MALPSQLCLSKDSLVKLKCSLCQKFLSVPPICLVKDKYTCGRCRPSGQRVTIYEELAKYMIFPCVYNKCKVQIPWGQVENHEINCPHKTISCPFGTCNLSYEIKSILKHFEEFHKMFIYTNELAMSRRLRDIPLKNFNADRKVFLLNQNNVPYIVMVYLDCVLNKKKSLIQGYYLAFGVYSIKSNQNASYEVHLCVKNNIENTEYTWDNQDIKLFNERTHCFLCLNGSCGISYHRNDKKNFLTSILNNIEKNSDMNLTYTIKFITKKHPKENVMLFNQPGSQVALISKLLCNFCRDIMCAPIFECSSGHSICTNCKRIRLNCPFCESPFTEQRNLLLENIAETLQIPCQNAAKGCKYIGLVKSTKQHTINCKYNFV